jgi:hypothetical protein
MSSAHSLPRQFLLAVLSSLIGLVVGLVIAEWGFRLYLGPTDSAVLENRFKAGVEQRPYFLIDPQLRYRPRHDEGGLHTKHGVYPNKYDPDDRKGKIRLLFVGDSVTSRGKIIDALKEVYGETAYEYWNAGVGGYDTSEELEYYLRYNRPLDADIVILTFHNNDFWKSYVILKDQRGRLVTNPPTRIGALPGGWWLMAHSRIAQWLVFEKLRLARKPPALDKIEDSLVRLRNEVQADGAVFKVVLHPSLKPQEQWSKAERLSRDKATEMLQSHEISYIDLLQPMNRALADGRDIQEKPDDTLHPSIEGSQYFATFLKENKLFEIGQE